MTKLAMSAGNRENLATADLASMNIMTVDATNVTATITAPETRIRLRIRRTPPASCAMPNRISDVSLNPASPKIFTSGGMGMILAGVTFLLATILGALRVGGAGVQNALGETVRMPKPPMTAQMFPMLMMLGLMILIASLVIGIILAFLTYDYWNHSIATELSPALEGSGLLDDLSTINTMQAWLAPIKFVGIAVLLSGIGLALATIVRVLR